MAAGAIRGSRVGSGPMGESERGDIAPRQFVQYYCTNEHTVGLYFAEEADVPESWDCPKCGLPAGRDQDQLLDAPQVAPYKTHLAYAKERRSEEEAESILTEAVDLLRTRRRSGEVIF